MNTATQPTKMTDTPEQKPTPETDALRDEIWDTPYRDGDDFSKMLDHAKKLESERDEAREQRDAFIKEIEIANERLRGKKHPDDNGIMVDGEIDIKQLLEQRDGLKSAVDCASGLLDAAIAERDVLLQAIRNLRDTKGRYHTQQAFESLMTLLPTNQND